MAEDHTKQAIIVDGPDVGLKPRVAESRFGWPSPVCIKQPGGEYQHYNHETDGRYRHAGTCASVGHKVTEWCDHTWHDDNIHEGQHRCVEADGHDMHRCCCGTEEAGRA